MGFKRYFKEEWFPKLYSFKQKITTTKNMILENLRITVRDTSSLIFRRAIFKKIYKKKKEQKVLLNRDYSRVTE